MHYTYVLSHHGKHVFTMVSMFFGRGWGEATFFGLGWWGERGGRLTYVRTYDSARTCITYVVNMEFLIFFFGGGGGVRLLIREG